MKPEVLIGTFATLIVTIVATAFRERLAAVSFDALFAVVVGLGFLALAAHNATARTRTLGRR